MNLNKFIPQWIIIMVKKVVKPGNGKVYELPNIILKPAPNDSNSDPLRQSEITELLSKIIRNNAGPETNPGRTLILCVIPSSSRVEC